MTSHVAQRPTILHVQVEHSGFDGRLLEGFTSLGARNNPGGSASDCLKSCPRKGPASRPGRAAKAIKSVGDIRNRPTSSGRDETNGTIKEALFHNGATWPAVRLFPASHVALQLPLPSTAIEDRPFAIGDRRRSHCRVGHYASFLGSGVECLASLQRGYLRSMNGLARSLQTRSALDRPFFIQNTPGLSRIVDVEPGAFLAGNDRHRPVPPHAFKRHGSIISGGWIEIEVGRRAACSQALQFPAADIIILAINEHARRVPVAKCLVRDEDPLPLAPLSQGPALGHMPRHVDRDLVRAVTHHAPHANQNAIQCTRRREVAASIELSIQWKDH